MPSGRLNQMEQNNTPNVPNTPISQPIQNPVPQSNTFTSQPAPQQENSSKFVMWLIVGLVLIIIVVGGIYLFLSSKQPVVEPAPTIAPQPQENLESAVNGIEIGDPDSDFIPLNNDLQQL